MALKLHHDNRFMFSYVSSFLIVSINYVFFFLAREDVRPDNGIHTGLAFQIALVVADFLFNTHRYAFSIDLYEDLLVLVRLLASGSELSPYFKMKEYHVYASKLTKAMKITRQVLKTEGTPERVDTFNYQQIKQMTTQDEVVATFGEFENDELKRDIAFYETLGSAFYSVGRFMTSIWYYEKAAEKAKVAEDRLEERRICTCLAVVQSAASQFDKATCLQERALQLSQEIGDVKGEVECYNNMGSFYTGRGQYDVATKFYEKGLELNMALNDTMGEAISYNNLGNMYHASGQYLKSIEYHMKSLRIREAANDTKGRDITYNNLSCVSYSLGQYERSIMYQEKALEISQTTGAKKQVAVSYFNLGCVYQALGKHKLSLEHHEKGLKVRNEIGDSEGESRSYREISSVHDALGHFAECMKYHEKALKAGPAILNRQEDDPSVAFGQRVKWIDHHQKGLEFIDEIGTRNNERLLLYKISLSHTSRLNILKASNYLSENIRNHEETRLPLEEEYKLSLDEQSVPLYKTLSLMLISFLHYTDALLALEQGRARALVDLVLSRYSIQEVNTTNFENLSGITSFFASQQNNFLFMATIMNNICLWFVDRDGNLRFKSYFVTKDIQPNSLLTYFISSRNACIEARTDDSELQSRSVEEAAEGLCEKVAYESEEQFGVPFLHHVIFGLADDLPDDEEIIFVPEGSLFHVPFAALQNADGNYLSEKVRLRLVPSITTLKIIQDAPADYHSQKGALLVGDPKVEGRLNVNGRRIRFSQLPCARQEVEMIAELLGVTCLVGESATKEEVLCRISNVSLVHIAAHADAERGEIVLAAHKHAKKEDWLLTMDEIANVSIRAQLVVLSTCHSSRGKVMTAEGVVGIARAFLGCGARSVLVTLWAIDDKSTLTFMTIFYNKLILHNMSVSTALQQSMKEMRNSTEYNDVKCWAPFALYGDDVTLDVNAIRG